MGLRSPRTNLAQISALPEPSKNQSVDLKAEKSGKRDFEREGSQAESEGVERAQERSDEPRPF